MKVTAVACSNIALVKYWGKRNEKLNIPQNNSISVTLDKLQTTTTVDFDSQYKKDIFIINRKIIKENRRLKHYIDYLRQLSGTKNPVKMLSESNFPASAGLASSASGFAALAFAGAKALDLDLSERDLSILARRGSGSACRSIFGGFVEWKMGKNSDGSDSHAFQIAPPNYWNIQFLIVISSYTKKMIPSTKAMRYSVETSPFYQGWLDSVEKDLENVRQGISKKDLKLIGETIERNCLKMHALMFSSTPSIIYWNETTINLIKNIRQWRNEGSNCYFTIDAGPNVVILCNKQDIKELRARIEKINNVQKIISCGSGSAPSISERDLF